jgi:hypothetical protein
VRFIHTPTSRVGKKQFTVHGVLGTGSVGAHATTDGFSTLHDAYLDIWGM